MVKKKQIEDAYLLRTLFWFVMVGVGFFLIFLRFVDADIFILGGIYILFLASYSISSYFHVRARTLARGLVIPGLAFTSLAPQADQLVHSASLPASERPPRSIS